MSRINKIFIPLLIVMALSILTASASTGLEFYLNHYYSVDETKLALDAVNGNSTSVLTVSELRHSAHWICQLLWVLSIIAASIANFTIFMKLQDHNFFVDKSEKYEKDY